jgi:hypothetical protein
MKPSFVLPAALALLAFGANAQAANSVCVDVHSSYEAHPQGSHDVIIRRTIGKQRPALLLSTSCFGLDKADSVSVSSQFGCIGLGDTVVATKIDGHRQFCRVTRVAPSVPAAAPTEHYSGKRRPSA